MPKSSLIKWTFSLVILTVAFSYGFASAKYRVFPHGVINYLYNRGVNLLSQEEENTQGVFFADENATGSRAVTGDLASLPYLKGFMAAPVKKNVTIYDPDRAFPGLNLVVSGHGPHALLMDMKGNVLHQWSYDFEKVWPGPLEFNEWVVHKTLWRRAHLFNNGDLLAIFEGIGMIKLDKDSNLLWAYKGRTHHDIFVDDKGYIYTLARQDRKEHNIINGPIWEDFIVILDPNGKEVRKTSLLDCFFNSSYAPIAMGRVKLAENPHQNFIDFLHTNTIEVFDGRFADRSPMFKKGNVLISAPTIHTIAVVDLEQEKVVWAMTGLWRYQHQPTLLENGNMLLFDNQGNGGKSQVIEFNPLTQEIAWAYKGSATNEFFSRILGSSDRLPNGNTLITESQTGRAFEVTRSNEIVWEWVNPNRAGARNELIASLLEVVRLNPAKFSGGFLAGIYEKSQKPVDVKGVKNLLDALKKQ